MIAPLSLSNLLTVLVAFACYVTASRQKQGGLIRLSALAAPAILAAIDAFVLLAGIIAASWQYDLEWLSGLLLGGVLGHLRGWRLSISADSRHHMILLPVARDAQIVALALIMITGIDFLGAYFRQPVVEPQHVAAAAAFLAGYLALRALAIAARIEQQARKPPQG